MFYHFGLVWCQNLNIALHKQHEGLEESREMVHLMCKLKSRGYEFDKGNSVCFNSLIQMPPYLSVYHGG